MHETTLTPIHEAVQSRYGRIADSFTLPMLPGPQATCCDSDPTTLSSTACCNDLYTADTTWLPGDVTNLSLGCGDPITLAELQPGQTVLDLGSGGGIDCFLAARQVGQSGYVIGVDMTPSMLEKANRNKAQVGLNNVEFRQGLIEALPVADATVDVIISNCVINLSPDKTAVFREAFRVLKPGGRLAVSDMLTLGHFSPEQRANMSDWAACLTGSEDVTDYVAGLQSVGFTAVSVHRKNNPEINLADLPPHQGMVEVFSGRVTAVKP